MKIYRVAMRDPVTGVINKHFAKPALAKALFDKWLKEFPNNPIYLTCHTAKINKDTILVMLNRGDWASKMEVIAEHSPE